MESVANALEAIVLCVQNGEDFRVSNVDPFALTISYIALWMYKNHGRNDVPAIEVESLIYSVCGHTQLQIIKDLALVRQDFDKILHCVIFTALCRW